MRVCAVIPAYNSQATIGAVVAQTRRYTQRVVVINDGSTDQTGRLAAEAGAHVIGTRRNRGKGHALEMAFKYAFSQKYDAVITLDADLQHDPVEIPKFIEHYKGTGADLIIGNRMHVENGIPGYRRLPNRIGTRCFSWLTGQAILDSQCGFRLYSRKIIAALPIMTRGFETESDLLLRAGRHGFRIEFIPVRPIYFDGCRTGCGKGSFYRPIRDTYLICINFLKNWLWRKR